MEKMTYGQKIRSWRKATGLTQKALGLKCGYIESSAERTVQFWEHDAQLPPLTCLRKLAEALGVTLDDLIP